MGCCDSKPEINSPTASTSITNRSHVEIEEHHAEQAWCGRKRRSKSQGSASTATGEHHRQGSGGSIPEGLTCPLHMPASQIRREVMKLQYREVTPEDYELLCLLDEGLPKKNTLPEALVQGLPLVPASDLSSKCCQVCLLDLGDCKVPQLPCGHAFHFECACKWLTGCSGRCPICQVSLVDLPAPPQMISSSSDPAPAMVSSDAQSPDGPESPN
ncbi:unnamed protein product [Effrenium voratum]|nr:unnamed protein product [Effrenium voratum]CAJ1434951.1 unnamed protein product [Effrenium voratum]|mmetsp:Transcript_71230/g.170100  ORF Transcript_71230/g.170100 Transcript_71230/m.170100 type:complete len:214 (+) Transcript_71230:72-713(+)|eukprot:CAMPEP_0181483050 /NCGR_PEP_ID=MMETSP1110-20121109/45208_1 /TAXON_ID=174948 /ORGANISM="Symbiodinium sp., Strain CCMP421" /LENGTH=213 /DNA_ID=CAMNT_0023608723 /DNA_START=72 /DNA_END=713 /DNA_ORIENTATION=-